MPNWKKVLLNGSGGSLSTLSLTGLSAQNSETDVLTINGSNVVGTRQLGSNAFTSTTIGTTTNNLTVDNSTLVLNTGTTFNGSAARTISAKTAAIAESGTGLATAAQIYTFVTGLGYGSGTVTSVGTNTGLSGTVTTSGNLSLALADLADMTEEWDNTADEFIVLDGGTQKRKLSSEIFGSNAFTSSTIPTNNNQLTNGAGYITNSVTSLTSLTSIGTLTSLTVDDITINGSTISDSGDLTLDIGGDLNIDVDGADIILKDEGTEFGRFKRDNSNFVIKSATSNKDIIFRGDSGGGTVDSLTLDMSDGGKALFNGGAQITGSLNITGSNEIIGSGSGIFSVEGSIGSLFTVDDGLDDVIFAANNISGTPVIEANADNTVKLGKLNGFGIVISGSTPAPSDDSANIIITGSIQHRGSYGLNVAASSTLGRLDASNDVVAFSTSDKRLKENVTPIENALDKVSQIQGVEFDWKPLSDEEKRSIHGNEGHDVGVIAQEVEKILPEVVQERDNGYKAVKYEKIIPLLVEAIKELQAEVQELKNSK